MRVARPVLARALVGLLVVAAIIATGSAAARARAPRAVLERPVSFEVKNTNTSGVRCASDGAAYTVHGHLVAPRSALRDGAARAVTVYLYGLDTGEWNWRFTEVPGYDFPAEFAKLGHVSVTIDMLGYGASGRPGGSQSCVGSQADVAHQIVGDLRRGDYTIAGRSPVAFSSVVLAGHDVGGQIAEIEAYSYRDVDGLIVVTWAEQGFTPFLQILFTNASVRCAMGGEPAGPAGPDAYFYMADSPDDFNRLFHNADPAVIQAATRLHARNPCGYLPSAFPTGIATDVLRLAEIKVPVLLALGANDPVFSPDGWALQKLQFTSSTDVTSVLLKNTGHFPMLERTAPQFRAIVSNWLQTRGFASPQHRPPSGNRGAPADRANAAAVGDGHTARAATPATGEPTPERAHAPTQRDEKTLTRRLKTPRRGGKFALLALPLAVGLGPVAVARAVPPRVCAWGGTPLTPTGHVHFDGPVGLRNQPAAQALRFVGGGALSAGPGCTGTMTFRGADLPGSTCSLFINAGTVTGLPGVRHFFAIGTVHQQGELYAPDGHLAGTYQVEVPVLDGPTLAAQCASAKGITESGFSATVELAQQSDRLGVSHASQTNHTAALTLPRTVGAHERSDLPLVGQLRLAVDFSPGMCAPGAGIAGCTAAAQEVRFRAETLRCVATGSFEGRTLIAAPCALHARGVLHPLLLGLTRPDCATGRVETRGAGNFATVNGERRRVKLVSVLRLDGQQVQSGWMDDADADQNPVGDHRVLVYAQAVSGSPFEPDAAFCVTAPLTHVEFESVVTIY